MAAHSDSLPTRIPFRTLRLSAAVWGVLALLVVVGLAAAVMGLGANSERAWLALHFNWLFWSSVAMGMVVFSFSLHITNARWSWPIRRFALCGAAFLPISFVLFFVQWGGRSVYFKHWIGKQAGDPVLAAKGAWLSLSGMFIRDTLALVVLFGLSLWFAYHALRPDLYGLDGSPGIYRRISGGTWRGAREEAMRSRRINLWLAAVSSILFALLWGLIAIDQAMTMLPHWYSTMFPVTFLVSAFHSALAMTAILMVLGRANGRLHDFIGRQQFHDLGKLVFAYAVFWMYVNWSQYVVIWYGLLPHEQLFFVQRFSHPFTGLTELMVACVFVFPFLALLARAPKLVPGVLAGVCAVVVFGHWLERFLITVPSVWTEDHLPMGLTEIGISLGFAGLFFASVFWFLKTFPLLISPASLAAIPAPVVTVQVPVRGQAPA